MTALRYILLPGSFALLFAGTVDAQWVQTNGSYGGSVCFAVSGTNLFAGGSGGVFLSNNNDTGWIAVNNGLTGGFGNAIVYSLAVAPNGTGGTNLFAGAYGGGVFLSTNNGTSWTAASTGLPNSSVDALAISPASGGSGTNLFAGTHGFGAFVSTNNGTSWTAVNSGLTSTFVNTFAVSGTHLFAGTGGEGSGGVFLSTNNGTTWTAVNTGLPTNTYVFALAVSPDGTGGTNLFAGTDAGVFRSSNYGSSWAAASTGLTYTYVRSLAISDTNLFAGPDGDVFLSSNNGTSWVAASTGLPPGTSIYALAVSGANLFAGTSRGDWRRPLSEMLTYVPIEGRSTDLPTHFSLGQNYPNPFNPTTTIRIDLPVQSKVRIVIFNLRGQQVAELANEEVYAGYFQKVWTAGVASGLYFCRLEAVSVSDPNKRLVDVKKMILLK